MKRRQFITMLSGAAASWPLVSRAQQAAMPVVVLLRVGSADAFAREAAAFREGLNQTGYVDRQNVTIEYHWLEGPIDRLPELVADLVRRQVAVIATPGGVTDHRASVWRDRRVHGGGAYYGTYTVSDADASMTMHVDGSNHANEVGRDVKRVISLNDDEMIVANQNPSGAAGSTKLTWKRSN
jgi:hypothetical protein